MRKLTKVLSVLLAIVMIFSASSIGVEAAYVAYKDGAITGYDSIDKPVLTTDQYASMAMDEVDRMLAEENLTVNEDLAGLLTISADFSSIDKALDSIASVYADVKPLLGTIKGDIQNIDFQPLLDCPHRGDAGSTDKDIFVSLFEFLDSNKSILAKVPYGGGPGGLDLGILGGFVDLGDLLDIPALAKKPVAKLVYPNVAEKDLDLTKTLDFFVGELFKKMVSGTYDGKGGIQEISKMIAKYAPGLENEIDVLNDSVYDIIDKGLKIAFDEVLPEFSSRYLKIAIRKFCGYGYDKFKGEGGFTDYTPNPSKDEINEYVKLLNINFTIDKFNFVWEDGESFTDNMNDILGQIVMEALNPTISSKITWDYSRGNDGLVSNLVKVVKVALTDFSDILVSSYIKVLDADTVRAMSDDQAIAYLLRLIFNASVDACDIPDSCDSTIEVLFEFVKTLAGDMVPSLDYSDLDASLDSMIRIGLDIAAVGLNQVTNMDLEFGLEPDEFADEAMAWVIENYGGFVSNVEGSGWEALSYVFFNLIPANYLPYTEMGDLRDNLYNILFEDIVGNVLDLNLGGVLKLISRNEDPDSELNHTIIEMLLGRITGIINYVLGDVFPEQEYSTLEGLLDPSFLSQVIENLFGSLYGRVEDLMPSLLPLLCSMLDLSTPAEFGYPYVSLGDITQLDPTLTTSFYMYNGSSGINTNATDKYGNTPKVPDKLYQYRIKSVETNLPGVTVTPSSNIYINGGTSQTFRFGGTGLRAFEGEVLKVTITYDVLEETGSVMTPQPLTSTTYSVISTAKDDGSERAKKDANTNNNHLVYLREARYINVNDKIANLQDVTFDVQRNASKKTTEHARNSTVTVTKANIDTKLAALGVTGNTSFTASTTKSGGTWSYSPYIVSNKEAKFVDYLESDMDFMTKNSKFYNNAFQFNATATDSAAESIDLSQYIVVYDDYGLGKLLSSAISANRQKDNYDMEGEHDAEYLDFEYRNVVKDEQTEDMIWLEEGVNGEAAWERYEEALLNAAKLVYAPRDYAAFSATGGTASQYPDAARELYTAIMQLEACSVSGGVASLKAALDSIIAPDTYIDAETGEEERYDYDDARRTFFAREDFIGYTYSNFKAEKREADKLLDKAEEGEAIDSVKSAYVQHRLTLYASRLVRVRAYTTYLDQAIAKYASVYAAGKGDYTSASWNAFERAYTFATAVQAEPIGATVSAKSDNLAGDGLRQSKVNVARAQLIKAAKRLVEGEDPVDPTTVDYTQISAKIAEVKATYDAGQSNYTAVSWAAFKTAYEEAIAIVAQNLAASAANQNLVNAKYTALVTAFTSLQTEVGPGPGGEDEEWSFIEDDYSDLGFLVAEGWDQDYTYLTGLDGDMISVVTDLIECGDYEVYVEDSPLAPEPGIQSTGATLHIVNSKGVEVVSALIVLFGDVNGDASIDQGDMSIMLANTTFSLDLDWAFMDACETAEGMAYDINHDGGMDGMDIAIMLEVVVGNYMINQCWKTDGDEAVI